VNINDQESKLELANEQANLCNTVQVEEHIAVWLQSL